jgi:hypothetical protein
MVRKVTKGSHIPEIYAKASGKTFEEYCDGIDILHIMHGIKTPFFFMSNLDD